MPTQPDMTTENTDQTVGPAADPAAGKAVEEAPRGSGGAESAGAGRAPEQDAGATPVLDAMQHQVAVFARRAEQTRLGGVGQARNSMDRAAYLLLNWLEEVGPMGVKALASGMGIDSSTVTRQVAPLVDAGLVSRTSHPEDGRAVVLELSPRGADRLEQVRSSRRELMVLATEGWSDGDRDTFLTLLTRFNSALAGMQPPNGAPGAAG